jgi:hypothetical protein
VLTLTWSNAAADVALVTGHIVEIGTLPRASNIGSVLIGSGTTFRCAGAVPTGRYFFRVRAVNAVGASAPSEELELTFGVPAGPQNLTSRIDGPAGITFYVRVRALGVGGAGPASNEIVVRR